jgi:hypothetical protein
MRSGTFEVHTVSSLIPGAHTASANGGDVDLWGYSGNAITILTGAFTGTSPSATFKVESSATGVGGWVAVDDSELDGVTGNASGFAVAAASVAMIGYIGSTRFIRVNLVAVGGTSTPTVSVAAAVARIGPKSAPVPAVN